MTVSMEIRRPNFTSIMFSPDNALPLYINALDDKVCEISTPIIVSSEKNSHLGYVYKTNGDENKGSYKYEKVNGKIALTSENKGNYWFSQDCGNITCPSIQLLKIDESIIEIFKGQINFSSLSVAEHPSYKAVVFQFIPISDWTEIHKTNYAFLSIVNEKININIHESKKDLIGKFDEDELKLALDLNRLDCYTTLPRSAFKVEYYTNSIVQELS